VPTSHPLSNTYSHAAERIARRSVHPGSEEAHPRPTSGSNSRALEASQSQSETMSSDELLVLREFLARRAEDLLTESSTLAGTPIPDQRIRDDDDASKDAASDLSEYGDTLSSQRYLSYHGQDSVTDCSGSHHSAYKDPHSHLTSVSESLKSLDGQSTLDHPPPSVIPSKGVPVASSARSLRRRSHTFSGSRSSSAFPTIPHYLELNPRSDSLASPLELEVSDPSNPPITALTRPEETQDLLPDFLDLSSDIDSPRLVTNRLSFLGSGASLFLVQRDDPLHLF
jgi:hypothetical protein